MSHTAFH